MATRRKLQKLFALLLTLSMTMSLLGVTAFAEEEEGEEQTSITITRLEEVGPLSVAFNTSKADVQAKLPSTLTGYYTVGQEEEPAAETFQLLPDQEGEENQNGTGTTPDDGTGTTPDDGTGTTPTDGTGTTPDGVTGTTPDGTTGTTPDGETSTTPDDETGTTPDDETGTVVTETQRLTQFDAPEEQTVAVNVTWDCADYDQQTAGTYTFTAAASAPEGYVYSGPAPSVQVTVEAEHVHNWVKTTTDVNCKAYEVCWECGSARGDGWYYDAETKTMYFGEGYPRTIVSSDYMTYPWYRLPVAGSEWKFTYGLTSMDKAGMIQNVVLDETFDSPCWGLFCYMNHLKNLTLEGDIKPEPNGNGDMFAGEKATLDTVTITGNVDRAVLVDIFDRITADTVIFDNPDLEVALMQDGGDFVVGATVRADHLIIRNAKSIGDYCFQDGLLKTVEIGNVGTIGQYAFAYCWDLTSVVLGSVGAWDGQCAFYDCYQLNSLTLTNATSIGEYAFQSCTALTSVTIPESCVYVGAGAFKGCSRITSLTIPASTQLGYSDIFVKFPDLVARMEALLAGRFLLSESPVLSPLTVPDEWESSHTGTENGTDAEDTQVTKTARWNNTDKTEAEVEFQFNYDKKQGMDFLFVVDYSGSMAEVGNVESDSDSRFASMQSKLLDVADELLNNQDYNNRVAFVTFATNADRYLHTQGFTQDYSTAESFVMAYQPYGATNYSIALDAAYDLIDGRDDTSREAAVIFISDGMPNRDITATSSKMSVILPEIKGYADKIKGIQQFGHDTKIFGVMQSVPASEEANCISAMQTVCTDGLFFLASDTQEFSDAVNNAIGAAYNTYTLVDTVDPAFTLDENSIRVSCGTYKVGEDAEGNTTITWTIYGVPYLTHTMQYQLDLNPNDDNTYPTGSFDTNEGNATVALDTVQVNSVATPTLTREAGTTDPGTGPEEPGTEPTPPGGGGGSTNVPDEETPTTELPEEETPTTELPEEETPTTELPEEETPLAEVPETGDMSALWLAMTALSGTGLAGVTFLGRKKRDEE